MDIYKDPSNFDYVFYPNKKFLYGIFFAHLFSSIVLPAIFGYFLFKESIFEKSILLACLLIFFGVFLFVLHGSFALYVFGWRNKVLVGVNKYGVYSGTEGMLYWDYIDQMSVEDCPIQDKRAKNKSKCIMIKTVLQKCSAWKKVLYASSTIYRRFGEQTFLIRSFDVTMPLDEFLEILKQYKAKYEQEN